MPPVNSTFLTEDEAALYDRQIRLWGLDSQKRLRASRILVVGMTGLSAEVCKNIILAGVKSLTILDDGNLTEEDVSTQFLAARSDVGKNRAEASLTRAQQLNPMVEITADTQEVSSKTEEFYSKFDVVCVVGCKTDQLINIDNICRKLKIKFYCGDIFGFFGYMFTDLQEHEYIEKAPELPVGKSDSSKPNKPPPPKKQRVDSKKCETFVPLKAALDVDWTKPEHSKRLAKMDPTYFVIRILMEFRDTLGRNPDPKKREEDIAELKKIKESLLDKMGVSQQRVEDALLKSTVGEVSPVCAVVGGILAQEIIKTVSGKGAPHNNMFLFNSHTYRGVVDCFGK